MRIEFDQFQLDTEQKQVTGPDGPVSLRPQTFAVLCYLVEQSPNVVSRDELLDAVWGHQATSVSSVAQTIKELRQALGDSSSESHLIATRRRLGYQFVGELRAVDGTRLPETVETELASPPTGMPIIRPWPWPTLAVLSVLMISLVFWANGYRADETGNDRLPTLAVAQMVNASDDPDLNWLGPALETYLGHALVELGGFRVVTMNPQALGNESSMTDIDYLIEGRYLAAGVDGSRLLARLRRPGSSELVTSVESSVNGWDVANLSINAAAAIRDRLGFSSPAAADAGALRARLPRALSSQRAYFAARTAIDNFQPDRALDEIAQARQQEPDNPRIDHLEALALKNRGDWAAARAASERVMQATQLWPRRDRLELEATAALLDFDYERAADRLQALTQFYPEAHSVRRLIEALIGAGRLQTADESLKSLSLQYPNDPRMALLKARLAHARGDHESRLAAAREAVIASRDEGLDTLLPAGLLEEASALIELGQLDEARIVTDDLFGLTELLSDADLASAHLTLARIQFQQGELPLALSSTEQALALFEAIPHPAGAAETLMVAGAIHDRAGRIETSLEVLEQAVDRFAVLGDKRRLARSNVQLGIALMRARQTEAAMERLEQGARHFRAAGDRQGEGAALLNHATLVARAGRVADAEPIFQRSYEAFVDGGDLRGQALALGNLSAIAGSRRDMSRATELAEEALAIFELLGAQTDIARVSYNLALTHRREGDLLRAESRIRQAAEAFAGQGAVLMQTRAMTTLGLLLVDMGRFDELDDVLAAIAELEIEDPAERSMVHAIMGERALVLGQPETARRAFERAHDLMVEIGAENHLLDSRLNLARVDLADDLRVNAEQTARELVLAFGELRMVSGQIDALLLLAEALIEQNRDSDASANLSRAEELLASAPDADQQLRLALLRSRTSDPALARERLQWVAETAGRQGFRPLMEQAQQALARQPDLSGSR